MDNIKLLEETEGKTDNDELMNCFPNDRPFTNAGQLEADNLLEMKLSGPVFETVLTKRETEILNFVLAGKTNKEIAQTLYRTERTVEYHRNRMMRKLGTHTTVELVKRAIAMGIV